LINSGRSHIYFLTETHSQRNYARQYAITIHFAKFKKAMSKRTLFLCFADRASRYNLSNWPT